MAMDVEANSKAAAERSATHAGMNVNHCQDISENHAELRHSTHRGEVEKAGSKLLPICVLVAMVGAVAWFFWPAVMQH